MNWERLQPSATHRGLVSLGREISNGDAGNAGGWPADLPVKGMTKWENSVVIRHMTYHL